MLETIIIETDELDRLAAFYEHAFHLGEATYTGERHVGWKLGTVYFGIDLRRPPKRLATPKGFVGPKGASIAQSETGARGVITLWFTVEDLRKSYARVTGELGARPRMAPAIKPWGGFIASIFDPDGNPVGLSQREPETEFVS